MTQTNSERKFGMHIVTARPIDSCIGGEAWRVDFENGYGVSIIRHQYSYGGDRGLFELAVMHDGRLCYESPITDDVIGCIPEGGVAEYLNQIAQLPTNEGCDHGFGALVTFDHD